MKTLIVLLLAFSATAHAAECDDRSGVEKEKCLSKLYLEKMAKEEDAVVADGGVVFRPIYVNAAGERPKVSDSVTISYVLTDREGKLIEATEDETATFPLDRLIDCWKIAVPLMTAGSHAKISCPSDTAYGDDGAGDAIPGGAALTFRITLFAISR